MTLAMSQANNTPLPYWLDMPLSEFDEWVKAAVELSKEKEDAE